MYFSKAALDVGQQAVGDDVGRLNVLDREAAVGGELVQPHLARIHVGLVDLVPAVGILELGDDQHPEARFRRLRGPGGQHPGQRSRRHHPHRILHVTFRPPLG
jgi:hypothetical protein